jgi:hypothetical protein
MSSFRQTPPDDEEGWERIWQTVHGWERAKPAVDKMAEMAREWADLAPTLKEVVTVMKAAVIARKAIPYALAVAALGLAIYNQDVLARMLGGG